MSKARGARLLSLSLLVFVVGCAGGGTWQQLKTKRITAYTDRPSDYRETMQLLEYAYAALSTFFPRAEVGEVEVLLMDGGTRSGMFGMNRGGFVLPTVPGGGRLGQRNLIVMSKDEDRTESPRLLSHLFIDKGIPGAPFWLHMMLEQFFQHTGVESGPAGMRACFGGRLGYRSFQRTTMPLDRYFAVGWKDFPSSDGPSYLGTSYQLGQYIFVSEGGNHLDKLPVIFQAAGAGTPGPRIVADLFPGMTPAQVDQRIYDFGSVVSERKGLSRCPVGIPMTPDRAPDQSVPTESPVSPQEIDQLMQALKRLPHGDRYPPYYPAEALTPKR